MDCFKDRYKIFHRPFQRIMGAKFTKKNQLGGALTAGVNILESKNLTVKENILESKNLNIS